MVANPTVSLFKQLISSEIVLNLSLSLTDGHFPGKPGLAGFVAAKDHGSGDDNWSYKTCIAPVTLSPPTNHHPAFYRPDAIPVAQPTVSKHCLKGMPMHVII